MLYLYIEIWRFVCHYLECMYVCTLIICLSQDHKNVQNLQESEDKINAKVANKKPKDLMRAIGTINETDWQLKQLEKKIRDTKFGAPMLSDKVGVPKWDKLQVCVIHSKISLS